MVIGGICLFWGCTPPEESEPPFPVDNQAEWRHYLQGTWTYAGASPSGSGLGAPVEDSLFLQLTFQDDTLNYLGETHQEDTAGKMEATCILAYGEPYMLEVKNCVRGTELRLVNGDTVQADQFSAPPGSPRSRKMAFSIGSVFPSSLRAISTDSLWMMQRGETNYYLTRGQESN
jgi:hypothetical protein